MQAPAAEVFLEHCGIRPERPTLALLHELGQAFSRLPYENLTKLLKKHRVAAGPERRRMPGEVVADHLQHGTGGTCFSLTTLFSEVLARLGYASFPVLCHTRHQSEGHCALVVMLDQGPRLLDPAYLLHAPLPLSATCGSPADAAHVTLAPAAHDGGTGAMELYTYGSFRYRFAPQPVPRDWFLALWDASFDWTMMNSAHVCAAQDKGYAYLHGSKLRIKTLQTKQTINVRAREAAVLSEQFGISATIVKDAYDALSALRRDTGRSP